MRLQTYARIAGFTYVFSMAAFIAYYNIVNGFAAPGDFARTSSNIASGEDLYRIGLGLRVVGSLTIVVLAWSFYALLRDIAPNLARLAMSLRMTEAGLGFVGTVFLYVALDNHLSSGDASPARPAIAAMIGSFNEASFYVNFILLGFGSAIYFFLLFRARFIPRLFALYAMLAAIAHAATASIHLVAPDVTAGWGMSEYLPMFFAEVGVGLWLLVFGVNEKHMRSKARTEMG